MKLSPTAASAPFSTTSMNQLGPSDATWKPEALERNGWVGTPSIQPPFITTSAGACISWRGIRSARLILSLRTPLWRRNLDLIMNECLLQRGIFLREIGLCSEFCLSLDNFGQLRCHIRIHLKRKRRRVKRRERSEYLLQSLGLSKFVFVYIFV